MIHAKYTVVLKTLMDNEQTNAALTSALSTYPLFQSTLTSNLFPTRSELNQRLLNNYKYREIGFETVGRFLDELQITMNEIMPHYNELYKTVETMAKIEDPFGNVDFTETFKETRSGSATNKDNVITTGQTSTDTTDSTSTETTDGGSVTTNTNNENAAKKTTSGTPSDSLTIAAKDIDSVDYADEINNMFPFFCR